MLKSFNCLLAISTIAFLFYCKGKDGNPGPKGDTGADGKSNATVGTSSGWVHLADEFGNRTTISNAGIKVTLLGSVPEISVETDTSGKFAFSNTKTGNYDLQIKKEGFPDYYYKSFIILEGPKPLENYADIVISKPSTTILSNLTAKIDSSYGFKSIKFKVKVSPSSALPQLRTVLFVMSNSPNVSIDDVKSTTGSYSNFLKTYSTSTTATADSAVATFGITVNSSPYYYYYPYNGVDFSNGKTIYCKAYGISRTDNNNYYSNSNYRVYPSASPNPSNTVGILIK